MNRNSPVIVLDFLIEYPGRDLSFRLGDIIESFMDSELIKISKFLSLVLRHRPEAIGLRLDEQGWAAVDEFLICAARTGRTLTPALIEEVIAQNDKKRFALSGDRSKIRAVQGHSIQVNLGLEPQRPPEILFHGTADRFLESIRI
jgi:putative RNA 2'-phosphotransferase